MLYLYLKYLHAAATGTVLADRFRTLYRVWFWLGVAGFSGMFLIVLMMVSKMTPMVFLHT